MIRSHGSVHAGWLTALCAASLTAVACGGGAETGSLVQRDTVAGVEVVRNDSTDRPLPWRLVERWRLGSLDGPDALYGVREIGLAATGGACTCSTPATIGS